MSHDIQSEEDMIDRINKYLDRQAEIMDFFEDLSKGFEPNSLKAFFIKYACSSILFAQSQFVEFKDFLDKYPFDQNEIDYFCKYGIRLSGYDPERWKQDPPITDQKADLIL